jgi:hypothetical protein
MCTAPFAAQAPFAEFWRLYAEFWHSALRGAARRRAAKLVSD